jgi:hypothetical protein
MSDAHNSFTTVDDDADGIDIATATTLLPMLPEVDVAAEAPEAPRPTALLSTPLKGTADSPNKTRRPAGRTGGHHKDATSHHMDHDHKDTRTHKDKDNKDNKDNKDKDHHKDHHKDHKDHKDHKNHKDKDRDRKDKDRKDTDRKDHRRNKDSGSSEADDVGQKRAFKPHDQPHDPDAMRTEARAKKKRNTSTATHALSTNKYALPMPNKPLLQEMRGFTYLPDDRRAKLSACFLDMVETVLASVSVKPTWLATPETSAKAFSAITQMLMNITPIICRNMLFAARNLRTFAGVCTGPVTCDVFWTMSLMWDTSSQNRVCLLPSIAGWTCSMSAIRDWPITTTLFAELAPLGKRLFDGFEVEINVENQMAADVQLFFAATIVKLLLDVVHKMSHMSATTQDHLKNIVNNVVPLALRMNCFQ